MKNTIKKIPIPLCGVMLGLAALGNLLQSYSEGIRYICGILAAFLLILVLLKLIMFPQMVREDMKNPIMASASGTFPMALMLLSVYLASGNLSPHNSDHIFYSKILTEITDAKSFRKLFYCICRNCSSICYSPCL